MSKHLLIAVDGSAKSHEDISQAGALAVALSAKMEARALLDACGAGRRCE